MVPTSFLASSRLKPEPSFSPRRRLREMADIQVNMASPKPARLYTVFGRPPWLTSTESISCKAWVMRAALELAPSPMPSMTPAPMASTFLMAPPYSTPRRSEAGTTIIGSPSKTGRISSTKAGSLPASMILVGTSCATSSAKLGPLKASALSLSCGSSSSMISQMVLKVLSSMPLEALTTGSTWPFKSGFNCSRQKERIALEEMTNTSISVPCTASFTTPVSLMLSWILKLGILGWRPMVCSACNSCSLYSHRRTL